MPNLIKLWLKRCWDFGILTVQHLEWGLAHPARVRTTGDLRRSLVRRSQCRRAVAGVVGVAGDDVGGVSAEEVFGGDPFDIGFAVEEGAGVDLDRDAAFDE